MSLPPELRRLQEEIREYAVAYDLDFFDVIFEMLDWRQINEVAAYGGFPNRYPHWRFGMEYERFSKSYAYGLSKIYEMVTNNDPCYAYLLHSNNLVDQKMVMAHVYGHSDFFKCNQYFSHTNRKMMDEMANHRVRVQRYNDEHGQDCVENFIDVCLSLENLVDYHASAIRRRPGEDADGKTFSDEVRKLGQDARPYMDRYINPPEYMEAQRKKIEAERNEDKPFPEHPERDVLNFLMYYAPLENWERDVLSIIREEALYYAPQGQTKIMNEGWACVTGDTRIVTNWGMLPAKEIVEGRLPVKVHDGNAWRKVIDWAQFPKRKTVRIETRRGLILEGSNSHTVLVQQNPDVWKRLDEFVVGDSVLSIDMPEIISVPEGKLCADRIEAFVKIAPDVIVKVDVGTQDVYDFTVEETHRYVAHGLINHNSYWHTTIMTQRAMKDSELIDYADHHSGTVAMAPGSLNPYKIGLELFRDIEERWNKGQCGPEYEECADMKERANWDTQLGEGRKKIFDVRRIYNDLTFIDTFLTPEFCQRHRMFVYSYNLSSDQYEIAGRTFDKIKQQMLSQLTNCGKPILNVVDANYHNRGELVLKHVHEGVDLRLDYAKECLKNIYVIWKRPVYVQTLVEGVPKMLSFDSEGYKEGRP